MANSMREKLEFTAIIVAASMPGLLWLLAIELR